MIDTFSGEVQFTLHIQLIFQLVRKHINWLLSNGTNLHQTLRPDFTAKLMMMMKDAMLSFGRTSVTKLIEIVLFLFITRALHGYGSIQVTRQVDPKYSDQVIKFMIQYQ